MSTSADEIREFYEENGYYHARGVFSLEKVRALETDFDRIVEQISASGEEVNARWRGAAADKLAPKDAVIVHTHNVQIFSAAWHQALLEEGFLHHAKAMLGTNVILHHTKLFQKPAEKGAPFPMHQDWTYFPTLKDTMMAGVIHVSRATEDMGCLRVYPRSHRLGRLPESGGTADSPVLDAYPIEKATAVEADPGDVVFFNYRTLHGSMPNRSSEVRKTVLVQMHSGEDAVEEGNAHPNARLVLAGWNARAKRSLGNF